MKIFRFFVIFSLLAMLLCFCVSADVSSGKCGDNVTYSYDDKAHVLTISGRGAMDDYATATGEHAPWGEYAKVLVREIVVEEGITRIGDYAFAFSWNVKAITLPESLESIGNGAFLYCREVQTLVIPDKVKRIGKEAFRECKKLTTLKLPNSLESLECTVISFCNALQSVEVPKNVSFIDQNAFHCCPVLEDITFTNTGCTFGHEAIFNCPQVTVSAYIDSAARRYAINYNIPYTEIKRVTPSLENFKRTNTYSSQFKDVNEADWFAENVKSSYEYALMLGTSSTEFSPSDNITVAEAITLAARIYSIYSNGKADFIQGKVWYQVYVNYCKNNGLLTELATNDYTKAATREEVIMIFSSILPKSDMKPINSLSVIPDYKKNNDVIDFYNAGILTGSDEERSFKPDTYITRAEISAIVTRMINVDLRVKFE